METNTTIIIAIAVVLISILVLCIKNEKLNVKQYFGGESQQKLLLYPNAGTKPKEYKEISEPALFRYLLNEESKEQLKEAKVEIPKMLKALSDIDKHSKITEFETHQSSMGSSKDLIKVFHVFIVFQTTSQKDGDYWWSLEKNLDFIVMQRSRQKDDVKDKCYGGEKREKVEPIIEHLKGKGTIKNLFAILWANQIIPEMYHIKKSNCQSFVTLVSKQITEIGYEYKGKFKLSLRENVRNSKLLDLINVLTGVVSWHPVITFIHFENTKLLDSVIESGNYDINATDSGTTLLNLSIIFSKSKMVRHLLDKWKADPTKRSEIGFNPMHTAVITSYENMDIIDLLLTQQTVDIDQRLDDTLGMTALHLAILVSNTNAVQHLIDRGANLNIYDNRGLPPLHVAAMQTVDTQIIDLLLEAIKKERGIDDANDVNQDGNSALHCAAVASNEITAEYLIKKGADVNYRNKTNSTPLHVAAQYAEDMKIIDLLLTNINEEDVDLYNKDDNIFDCAKKNENGLGEEILARLREKGIVKIEKPKKSIAYDVINEWNAETGAVTLRFIEKGADPTVIAFTRLDGLRIARAQHSQEIDRVLNERKFGINDRDRDGKTPLYYAARAENVTSAIYLLEKGADPTASDNDGFNPLDMAIILNKDTKILEFILENREIDIEKSDENGRTALHYAIMGSNVTTARYLLSKRAKLNVADKKGDSSLHLAVKFAKDMDIVDLLLNQKEVDVHCLNKSGQNALQYAKSNKHGLGETIVKRLKDKCLVETTVETGRQSHKVRRLATRFSENKGKCNQLENLLTDDSVQTEDKVETVVKASLLYAIRNSNVEIVSRLLETGLIISRVTWENGINALHMASYYAKATEFIDIILNSVKFDINGADNDGRTPLHYAMNGANPTEIARHLIGEKGADPNIADKNRVTPLQMAASFGKTIDLIDFILKTKQIDINVRDNHGITLLHTALNYSNVAMTRYLLENGADPTIRDEHGITPFHVAAAYSKDKDILDLLTTNTKVVIDEKNQLGMTALHMTMIKSNATAARFLLENGANPNEADEDGRTPLHIAAKFAKAMDIVELLLDHEDVDVNFLDKKGQNALHFAKYNDHGLGETIANLLKEKGAVERKV